MSVESKNLRCGLRYRYDKLVRGKRIKSPAIFLTSKDAELAESQAVAHYLLTGQIPLESSDTSIEETKKETVLDLIERRISWLRKNRGRKHAYDQEGFLKRAIAMVPDWAMLPADSITAEMVSELKDKMAENLDERGKSRYTVNATLQALQSCWNCPWENLRAVREYPNNPFRFTERMRYRRAAILVPTEKQVKKVVGGQAGEKRLYLEILTESGGRPGEVRDLKWDDINFNSAPFSVTLWTAKKRGGNKTPRKVPISPALARKLKQWKTANPETVYVFQQEEDEAPHVDRWIANLQKEACETGKVGFFKPHHYRHYCTSKWLKEGVDLATIQMLLGHESFSTTARYIHQIRGVQFPPFPPKKSKGVKQIA